MNENLLVSIVVPTYRRENELINALNSIAGLDYPFYEIILIDDNDHLEWNEKVNHIVTEFQKQYTDIHINLISNHPNLGSAKSRNIGIEAARGKYVCFLDDDDIYRPKRIDNQLKPMLEADADYSITDLELYNENDQLVEVRRRKNIEESMSERLFQYHLMYHMTGTDTLMFKKDYLIKIGAFDPIDVGDEFYLMSKAILANGKFVYIPTCDVKAYVHDAGGISSSDEKINGENRLYEYKKQYFGQLDRKAKRYIKMRHHLVLGFTYFKKKKWCQFMKEGIFAVFIDFKSCMTLLMDRKKCR